MRRKSLCDDACTVARSLDIIGDWWSLLIMRDVLSGKRRFGELQRSLGAAKNILASRLKDLVANGILETSSSPDGHREYAPTPKGVALRPVLVAIGQWGAEQLFDADEPRYVTVDASTGQPLATLELRSQDGRRLADDEVAVAIWPAGAEPSGRTVP